ncbi:hypothetical protein EHQ68_10100 [Leptospira congkakensis]|uniref:Ligase n=1 Tax=Leptospira congkakensis TaxID=2484932 RepID=A0A4Z1A9D9_9LEPT|nr:hypothetical protein [Leptospira congkakensis]TGL88176.1 hypothetical protein EHQ68_10100 [Leptospira congkakensis]TGL95281.1 hypothetical protein EHQ69_02285 [Leptospira congkakensis]TGL96363.1 hypothetical protein EHQ70_09335 [Leptospira congkakensis]
MEPVPGSHFYPSFLLQFAFGFFPQMYQRKWGRIFTALGVFTFLRLPYLSGLPMVGSYQLVGLFLGSILGIWTRELILVLLGRNETALPKQSEQILTDWMIRNPTGKSNLPIWYSTYFGFIFFLCLLTVLCLFQYQGLGLVTGLGIQEYFYFPTLSSREAMGLSCKILVPTSFVILYLFSEERSMPTPSKDSLSEQLRFGLFLGLGINLLVMSIQSIWSLDFFSAGTLESVKVGRSTGLFQDSGSASWILPVLSLLWISKLITNWRKSKERFSLVLAMISFLFVTWLGLAQGKAFWIVWAISNAIGIIHLTTDLWIISITKKRITRIGLYLLIPILGFLALYGLSFLQKDWDLVELSKRTMDALPVWKKEPYLALKRMDLMRAELLTICLEGIKNNLWLGNGIGSFPLGLLDPSRIGTKTTNEMIDFPPNFFLWLVHDLGFLGSFVFFFFISLFLWERGLWKQSLLLILPFLFGVQIQNSDGAFLCFYLVLLGEKGTGFSSSFDKFRKTVWFSPLLLILSIGLPLNYGLFYSQKYWDLGIGSEFRKTQLREYQVAATLPPKSPNYEYEFHGRVWEWKLSEYGSARVGRIFLETTNKSPVVEVLFLNSDRVTIKQELFTETKFGYSWSGECPKGASFIRLKSRSKLEFRLPRSQFDGSNRIQF